MSWATVTCGWYGKCSSRDNGPARTAAANCSNSLIPAATATNTTWVSGRNVPVPRSGTCDGMNSASGSPASARAWSSALPHGSGIPIATPTRSVCTSGTAGRGQEADPLVHRAQRDGGDRAGLLGADREHLVQVGRVVEQGLGALLHRPHELHHDLA